jgi:type II secretion system protein N
VTRKETIGGVALLVCLFPLLVILFIPSAQVEGVVRRMLARQGYVFTADHFGKAFPLGITARNVTLADSRGVLLQLDRLSLRPALLPLLTGTPTLSADAVIGNGTITLDWRWGRSAGINADISGLSLEQVPFFRSVVGATVKGRLRGEARLVGVLPRMNGTVKMEVTGVELADLKIGELPLPAVVDETIQGMLRVRDGRGRVESLTFSGSGLYARVSGEIPLAASAPLELMLELMPKADFLEKQKFVFLLLVKYLDSPGHYRLPIRGSLAKPSLF